MGRGKRTGTGRGLIPLSLDDAASRLPESLLETFAPDERRRRIRAVQALFRQLEPYFTSTRRLSKACGQMEITLLPWYNGTKCPSQESQVDKIRDLIAFLPRLDAISGDQRRSGLWLVTPHYGLPKTDHPGMYGLRYPSDLVHRGQSEDVLEAARDDFEDGARRHREALEHWGHELLPKGRIRLQRQHNWSGGDNTSDSLSDSPFFHRQEKIGKTLAEKKGRSVAS